MDQFFDYVETHEKDFIERLSKAVAIPSVSSDPAYRAHVFKMAEFLIQELKELDALVETRELGQHTWQGKEYDLPPIILASVGNDPEKKTILVYGHYDVQPALLEDGWDTNPFQLVQDDEGRLIGRGATDDKGPVLGWINVVEAHKKLGIELPVNLKFCLEGMEESGSVGLEAIIFDEATKYFKDVDAVCISDNYWLGTKKPCLTYGLRGCNYFHINIKGPRADLHSGVFGGTVHEPMIDLVTLMSKLVDGHGKILVPGIYEQVQSISSEEEKTYDDLSFEISELDDAVGNVIHLTDNVRQTLQNRWRNPSLSFHGIEGAFYNPGDKTVIPASVTGKFSIRTVPDMVPEKVTDIVVKYVEDEFAKLGSKNKISVCCTHYGPHWLASPDHPNYVAASEAVEAVYDVKPDLTREGCSIPVTISFQEALQKNVLLLPMGRSDDGAHSINEKLDKSNYIKGTQLLGAYLYKVSQVEL